ncbi:hypothetical protein BB559_003121 [Furculomyces boomerangus]|uniref:Large ribosomal subunit protein bL32m n=2 Tax=Harpellales TaxID=61421 RepID=A0A2T9YNR8_9FUNG|nr:hypothetical protein BB559_003121 [Furculomyces boomerangus]PWA00106.1 hypothetical protein BB558_003852 [Smittium angustum]
MAHLAISLRSVISPATNYRLSFQAINSTANTVQKSFSNLLGNIYGTIVGQSTRKVFNLGEILGQWILKAVPKKKTTHSKKRMRSAGKGLKNRTDIVRCSGCGKAKLLGHLCLYCYKDIRRKLRLGNLKGSLA